MIAALALAAAAAVLQAQPILTIGPKHRIVEGIASDGKTMFVSSIIDRKLLACTTTQCRTFAVTPPGLHPFGIAWDAMRKRLWVAASCPKGVPGIVACERGALLGYDARGRLMTRVASAGGTFLPGDVSVSSAGVFVSDSSNGAVHRLADGARRLEIVLGAGIGKSGQGSALSVDGKTLIVADYAQGIAAIDLASGTRVLLPRVGGKPLRGIDGLVRCGSTYYGLYNGASPGTLVAITRSGNEIAVEQPLGELVLADPTQVAIDGDRLLIVADSGWATIGEAGFVRSLGTVIMAVDVPGGCTGG
ncbi:MAG: hypothetical protein ABIO29_06880 [Sphingomicrobium sp.]